MRVGGQEGTKEALEVQEVGNTRVLCQEDCGQETTFAAIGLCQHSLPSSLDTIGAATNKP